MNLSPDEVLARCPVCGAWPMSMAARIPDSSSAWGRLVFRCSQCDGEKTLQLTVRGITPDRTDLQRGQ
jgi:formate dehydrogenase maturation protein FdhE